jgi:chromosome segregation ATPase
MLPVAQKPAGDRYMATLNTVRSYKSPFTAAISEAPEGSTTTEVKLLKMQLKAREMEDAKMRSDIKELKTTVDRLQDELKTQQQAATNAGDLQRRIVALEDARQAADRLHSEYATKFSDLSAQQQALHTRLNETEKSCTETNSKATSLDKGVNDINQDLRGLRQTHETLHKDVAEYIGPVRQAYVTANEVTVLQRIANLEDTSTSMCKEQGHLSSQMENLSSRPLVKQEEFEALKSVVGSLEEEKQVLSQDIDTKITRLSNAHDHLSTCVEELAKDRTASTKDADHNHAIADFNPSKERLLALEKRIISLTEGLNELRTKGEDLQTMVEVNETAFIEILGKKIDPLEASLECHRIATEKKLQSIEGRLQLTEENKTVIDEKLESYDRTTKLSGPMAEQLQGSERKLLQQLGEVKQDLARLRDDNTRKIEQLKTATGFLHQALASKQDTAETLSLIDSVKFALQSLQVQYDNISTGDLYTKMSHWILQQYPNSPAAMLQQLEGVKHDINQLRIFTDAFTQMPDSAETLVALAKLRPEIVALVKAQPESVQSQAVTAKLDKGLSKLESLETMVSGLQGSLNVLNSDNSPFVKNEYLQQSMSTLRDGVETVVSELRTRVEQTGDALKLETRKNLQNFGQVESLQQDVARLRQNTNEVLEDFKDPATKHCIDQLPILFVHTGQLQFVVENLAANMPRGPLRHRWHYDFKEMFKMPSPFLSEATGGS